jgi:hypothetical protein
MEVAIFIVLVVIAFYAREIHHDLIMVTRNQNSIGQVLWTIMKNTKKGRD